MSGCNNVKNYGFTSAEKFWFNCLAFLMQSDMATGCVWQHGVEDMVVVLRDGLHQCQLLRMVMMAFDFFVVLQIDQAQTQVFTQL